MMKKITGTVLAGIAAMMLTTTAFAGQGSVNTAPSTTQSIECVQTNGVRSSWRRKRPELSKSGQTNSARGSRRHWNNFVVNV